MQLNNNAEWAHDARPQRPCVMWTSSIFVHSACGAKLATVRDEHDSLLRTAQRGEGGLTRCWAIREPEKGPCDYLFTYFGKSPVKGGDLRRP